MEVPQKTSQRPCPTIIRGSAARCRQGERRISCARKPRETGAVQTRRPRKLHGLETLMRKMEIVMPKKACVASRAFCIRAACVLASSTSWFS